MSEPILLEPTSAATHSLIFLHGLGDCGESYVPLARAIPLPEGVHMRFVLPTAPLRPITLNNGYVMNGWYDILSLDRFEKEDEAGLQQAVSTLMALIQAEIDKGIPSNRIFIGGFSQGCAVSLLCATRFKLPLSGIIGLSGYLPLVSQLQSATPTQAKHAFYIGHGQFDNVVAENLRQMTVRALQTQGFGNISQGTFPIEHSISLEELNAVGAFISAQIAAHT